MKQINPQIIKSIKEILRLGGVGVLPTDTLYGLVGPALDKKAVLRIYKLKKRSPQKPFIILIAGLNSLESFGAILDSKTRAILRQVWPNPISVILQCPNLPKELFYMCPINQTLAFRCPKEKWLHNLLKQTGPLVAPSANSEGAAPAETIAQAKVYFSDQVDFYLDVGTIKGEPSTLIAIRDGNVIIERQGQVKVEKIYG
ncbi:MAG: L-threonylcarbamoyladenylate synthase [Candidatus Pacebacteria bacterium]|nr:L-threonylcarbamoyladenylate synthase [Candidatus Paceibacterota bacterium]